VEKVIRAIRVWLNKEGVYRDFVEHLHSVKHNPINGALIIVDTEENIVASYKNYERFEIVDEYRGPGTRYVLWDLMEES